MHPDQSLDDVYYDEPSWTNALGRLAAVVVTLGLGWALAFAFSVWIIARLVAS